jgi:hypothetical protein
MNRNQKIALGCGGAGCLGLIVVIVAGGLIYFFSSRAYSTNRNYNYNVNTANRNVNLNSNDNQISSTPPSTSASSLSDDDKHKLYHAALMTNDQELLRRVEVKIGIRDADFTRGDKYQDFLIEHAGWVLRNTDFISSLTSAEEARDYVNKNFPN